jgi:hypothetical protein
VVRLTILEVQVSITLFGLLRWRLQARANGKVKRTVMLAMSVASIALGALASYDVALDQYRFL